MNSIQKLGDSLVGGKPFANDCAMPRVVAATAKVDMVVIADRYNGGCYENNVPVRQAFYKRKSTNRVHLLQRSITLGFSSTDTYMSSRLSGFSL